MGTRQRAPPYQPNRRSGAGGPSLPAASPQHHATSANASHVLWVIWATLWRMYSNSNNKQPLLRLGTGRVLRVRGTGAIIRSSPFRSWSQAGFGSAKKFCEDPLLLGFVYDRSPPGKPTLLELIEGSSRIL